MECHGERKDIEANVALLPQVLMAGHWRRPGYRPAFSPGSTIAGYYFEQHVTFLVCHFALNWLASLHDHRGLLSEPNFKISFFYLVSEPNLEVENLSWCDFRRIDERQRPVTAFQHLVVPNNASPLQRKPYVFSFPFVETRMDTMLEIRWLRNLRLLLLFGKHVDNSEPR